jgi:hypothetical protein
MPQQNLYNESKLTTPQKIPASTLSTQPTTPLANSKYTRLHSSESAYGISGGSSGSATQPTTPLANSKYTRLHSSESAYGISDGSSGSVDRTCMYGAPAGGNAGSGSSYAPNNNMGTSYANPRHQDAKNTPSAHATSTHHANDVKGNNAHNVGVAQSVQHQPQLRHNQGQPTSMAPSLGHSETRMQHSTVPGAQQQTAKHSYTQPASYSQHKAPGTTSAPPMASTQVSSAPRPHAFANTAHSAQPQTSASNHGAPATDSSAFIAPQEESPSMLNRKRSSINADENEKVPANYDGYNTTDTAPVGQTSSRDHSVSNDKEPEAKKKFLSGSSRPGTQKSLPKLNVPNASERKLLYPALLSFNYRALVQKSMYRRNSSVLVVTDMMRFPFTALQAISQGDQRVLDPAYLVEEARRNFEEAQSESEADLQDSMLMEMLELIHERKAQHNSDISALLKFIQENGLNRRDYSSEHAKTMSNNRFVANESQRADESSCAPTQVDPRMAAQAKAADERIYRQRGNMKVLKWKGLGKERWTSAEEHTEAIDQDFLLPEMLPDEFAFRLPAVALCA